MTTSTWFKTMLHEYYPTCNCNKTMLREKRKRPGHSNLSTLFEQSDDPLDQKL